MVYSGPVADLLTSTESLTGAYLSGRREIALPAYRRRGTGKQITVHGAYENNLRDVDVSFPMGKLIAVTGVSGSGKSTLVNKILYTALAKQIYHAKAVPGTTGRCRGGPNWSTRSSMSTSPDRADPRGRTRPPTPACSIGSANCSPRRPRRRSAATSPAGSPST